MSLSVTSHKLRTRLNTGGVLRKARLLTQGAELRHGKKCNFY